MQSTRNRSAFPIIARVLGATLAAGALAACNSAHSASAGSGAVPLLARTAGLPASSARLVRADAAGCPADVVYVVSATTSSIKIFNPAKLQSGPCGAITGLGSPQGLFVDTQRNLWIADAGRQQVYKFTPGADTPAVTLNDPNGIPVDVTVDESSQTVYVTEYQNNVSPNTLAEVYANGSVTPTGSLSDPDARNGGFNTVDNQGNLYVTFMTQSNKAQVDRWVHGAGTPQNLGLELVSAGAIVTTASGALAVCDPFAYRCGVFERGSLKMSHVFGHMGFRHHHGPGPDKAPWLHPDALALDRSEHNAYVAANSLSSWNYPGPDRAPNHLPRVEIRVPGGAGEGIAVSLPSRAGAPY